MPPESPEAKELANGARARVLVVEDERLVALDIGGILEELGYSVSGFAVSGEEAIAKAHQLRPDLVLMDVRLEGAMEGPEAALRIQRELDCPIIYLTAFSDDDTLARAKRAEPLAYLLKPFTTNELKCALEIAIDRQRKDAEKRQMTDLLVSLNVDLQERVLERGMELDHAYHDLGMLGQSVAHEMRNPLNVIHGLSQLLELKDRSALAGSSLEELRGIQDAARRMNELVDDLQLLARLNAGVVRREPVNLTKLARVAAYKAGHKDRARSMIVEVEEELTVAAEPELLGVLIEHLLLHMQKLTPKDAQTRYQIGRIVHEGAALFFVHQDIPGAPNQPTAPVSAPGVHVGTRLESSGIKMATAQRIVDKHGGQIFATGDALSGMTMYFSLSPK